MLTGLIAVFCGLALLIWSATRFVDGASMLARHLGMSPLLIGIVIVGFGTSAPEMVVSASAAYQGSPGIALGNAYGSNITNIALILGLTAFIRPLTVQSQVLRTELPVLLAVTLLSAALLVNGFVSRMDALILLLVFAVLMVWVFKKSSQQSGDNLGLEVESTVEEVASSPRAALLWLVFGLLVLIASSRLLVWGAVSLAQGFGVSDLLIGLTVIAIGTSMPELASSVVAARRGQNDIALGNIIGSNLFNTLVVVGIAGGIHPMAVAAEVLQRDVLVMGLLTVALFAMGYGFRGVGSINRVEGGLLLGAYLAYSAHLATTVL